MQGQHSDTYKANRKFFKKIATINVAIKGNAKGTSNSKEYKCMKT